MSQDVTCMLCDKKESECGCDRYCSQCKSQHSIRLCMDGQYYCPDCREACEVHTVSAI